MKEMIMKQEKLWESDEKFLEISILLNYARL